MPFYTMEKIMIFTGAGFGKSLGLPTTQEFNKIIDSKLNGYLQTALQNYLGDKYYDIEHLLSTLELFCLENNSLIKKIINHPPFPSNSNEFGHLRQVANIISNLRGNASTFLITLKKSLFEILEKYDRQLAVELYKNVLSEIKNTFTDSAISIFTTNYDLTFEYAQDELDAIYNKFSIEDVINDGFITRKRQNIYDPSYKYDWSPSTIEYKKLHGSLDWIRSPKGIIKTNTVISPSELTNMLLIYPGFKGTPTGEPYKNLHDDLLERLLSTNSVFVIGFAFRDDYINNQFDTALKINKDLFIYCYNPANLLELPKESKIEEFTTQYPKRFLYKQKAVIASDKKPLELGK